MTIALNTPILDGGIRNTHWFQGRLLAVEDLQTEQDANRTHHRALGRALGAGVIEGLMVERGGGDAPTLRVGSGCGFNRTGQLVYLGEEVVLTLSASPPEAVEAEAGLFQPCLQPTGAGTIDGDGIYLLVARPASGFRERAPASGLESDGKVTGCGSRYAMEGITFRLVPWVPSAAPGQDGLVDLLNNPTTGTASLLRNWVAHRFLGSEALDALAADPFRAVEADTLPGQPGALSELYQGGQIDACDLPLALLYWPAGGLQWADPWAVRRAPTPAALDPRWAVYPGAGTAVAGRARLRQFQHQLDDLLAVSTTTGAADIRARRDFRFLPPLALLPVHPASLNLPSGVGVGGIRWPDFFDAIPTAPLRVIDGALLPALVEQSLLLPPFDLPQGGEVISAYEVIHVYQTTRNAAAVATGTVQPFYVMTANTLAVRLQGHLNAARFDRAEFA